MYKTLGFVTTVFLALGLAITGTEAIVTSPVERPLSIGSFNIQNLGISKSQNQGVMDVVKKVLLRYDLVLIQEIVTTDETVMENLLRDLNKMVDSDGGQYLMTISDRLGRGTAKEQYAFLYRSDKLKLLGAHVYPDSLDDFMRPPYIAHFSSPTLRSLSSLLAVGVHTQPKNAANETSALAQVYNYSSKHYKVKDAIIMGDMNVGCANVRINDWESIDLWTREEFTWLIKHDIDTTVSINCCPYDRFVVAGDNILEDVIWDSIGIFNFREAFGLNTAEALAVSDHWPIEFNLKGLVSEDALKNVKSTLCLTVDDERQNSLPSAILSQKTTMGFKIELDETTVVLEKRSPKVNDLVDSLAALKKRYPGLLSNESLAVVSYKATFGALNDLSSHQEFDENDKAFDTYVEFERLSMLTKITVCTETFLN